MTTIINNLHVRKKKLGHRLLLLAKQMSNDFVGLNTMLFSAHQSEQSPSKWLRPCTVGANRTMSSAYATAPKYLESIRHPTPEISSSSARRTSRSPTVNNTGDSSPPCLSYALPSKKLKRFVLRHLKAKLKISAPPTDSVSTALSWR
jgi:hypothetical protein